MSNKITFSKTSEATLSWKLLHNDKDVTKNLEDLKLYVNGTAIEVNPNDSHHILSVSEDTNFYVSAKYNGMDITSGIVTADFERVPQPCYYGTVEFDPYEWEEAAALSFINGLDKDKLDLLTDNNPILVGAKVIANPGKLVKTFDITPNNNKYFFYCAGVDGKVKESRPIVLYPTYFGETVSIWDGGNNKLDINKEGGMGLFHKEIKIGEEPYYVYLLKTPNATDPSGDPAPMTFATADELEK